MHENKSWYDITYQQGSDIANAWRNGGSVVAAATSVHQRGGSSGRDLLSTLQRVLVGADRPERHNVVEAAL